MDKNNKMQQKTTRKLKRNIRPAKLNVKPIHKKFKKNIRSTKPKFE